VVETFSSPSEFLARLGPESRGCVILDLQMEGITGLEVQEALARGVNPLPVIFLTGQGDIPATVLAMRRGAEDFLTKRSSKEMLLSAVRRALDRDARERAARQRRLVLRRRFDALTTREREVLDHVLKGKLNKQIAFELGVNERTVKLHRTSMTSKLQVQSLAELINLAHQAGLFGLPG
jgi:FixJ family two-component response regulator